jgi:hypothetical protein
MPNIVVDLASFYYSYSAMTKFKWVNKISKKPNAHMVLAKRVLGIKVGRLTVVGIHSGSDGRFHCTCRCSCGNLCSPRSDRIIDKTTKSCGCLQKEAAQKQGRKMKKHGFADKIPEYAVWLTMKQRCLNPNRPDWPRYGGRGIKVCERWVRSFALFIEDMGRRPTGLTIERRDNEGNYSPHNCYWATHSQQNKNRRPFKRFRKKSHKLSHEVG